MSDRLAALHHALHHRQLMPTSLRVKGPRGLGFTPTIEFTVQVYHYPLRCTMHSDWCSVLYMDRRGTFVVDFDTDVPQYAATLDSILAWAQRAP
jgi:hypothetical protein